MEPTTATGPDDAIGWAILELMGHRRLAGWVSEQTVAGTAMLRLDVPEVDGQPAVTQLYSGHAVYAITPTTEALARQVARAGRPAPVSRYELPPPAPAGPIDDVDDHADWGDGL